MSENSLPSSSRQISGLASSRARKCLPCQRLAASALHSGWPVWKAAPRQRPRMSSARAVGSSAQIRSRSRGETPSLTSRSTRQSICSVVTVQPPHHLCPPAPKRSGGVEPTIYPNQMVRQARIGAMRAAGEATRERILAAAKAEFAAYGVAGARINRIATAARASKDRLYAYFPGKDELYAAVVERWAAQTTAETALSADDLPGYAG